MYILQSIVGVIFLVLTVLFYLIKTPQDVSPQIFLTLATFLFATFTGFFIARQGRRYSDIRNQITSFDGEVSSIFRQFGHFGTRGQKQAEELIKKHYATILKKGAWDYHITHKSSTITELHKLAQKISGLKPLPSLTHLALQRILTSLQSLQIIRKKMVALHAERIPQLQWFLIYFLAILLLLAMSLISSQHNLFSSMMKAAFSSTIITVIILLRRFDSLKFFEANIGERSARDILEIFSGKK